jgi:hypothetical protein
VIVDEFANNYRSDGQVDDMFVLIALDEVVDEIRIQYGLDNSCDK